MSNVSSSANGLSGSSLSITTTSLDVTTGYSCVFVLTNGVTNYTASATGTVPNLSCTVPVISTPLPNGAFANIASVYLYHGSVLVTQISGGTLTIYDCGGNTNCASCVAVSPSYSCGWCPAQNLCTFSVLCVLEAGSGGWSNAKCPIMGGITPAIISVGVSTAVTLSVQNVPDLDSTEGVYGTYYCDFSLDGAITTVISSSSVTVGNTSNVICPSPDYSYATSDHDHVSVDLRVISNSQNFTVLSPTVNSTYTLFNCSAAISVTSCAGWDSASNICRTNPTTGYPGLITSVGGCPSITGISPLIVSAGAPMNITLTGAGFVASMSYICQYSNNQNTTGIFVSTTQVKCPIPLLYTGPTGIIAGIFLQLSYVGEGLVPSTASSNNLTFVACPVFSGSCFTCLSAYTLYGGVCGWCTNSGNFLLDTCQYASCASQGGGFTFSQSTCSQPTVSSISPLSGPVAGGTLITITGTNFISSIVNITLGTATACLSVTYVSPTTVTCVTPTTSGALVVGEIDVSLYFNILSVPTFAAPFKPFVITSNPAISSFLPIQCLLSGTTITLRGTDFSIGSSLSVNIGSVTLKCSGAGTFVNLTMLVCIAPLVASPFSDNITLTIDGSVFVTSTPFAYRPNPSVTSFSPAQGPIGGEFEVNIQGYNLDAAYPDVPGCTVYGFECIVVGSPGPFDLNIQLPELPPNATSNSPTGVFIPIILSYGDFLLVVSSFQFFDNPFVALFYPTTGPVEGNTTIVIIGSNLWLGELPVVYIGDVQCVIETYDVSELTCVTDNAFRPLTANLTVTLGQASNIGGLYSFSDTVMTTTTPNPSATTTAGCQATVTVTATATATATPAPTAAADTSGVALSIALPIVMVMPVFGIIIGIIYCQNSGIPTILARD